MDWKEMDKLTVVKLREEALKHPEIKGVHGKSKAQLMDELATILGIEKPHLHLKEEVVHTKEDLRKKIHDLQGRRDAMIQVKDYRGLHSLRREVHKLKRQIRKIEHAKGAQA
jgi:predicted  nucleic acid-binding Zn-ribbon protein